MPSNYPHDPRRPGQPPSPYGGTGEPGYHRASSGPDQGYTGDAAQQGGWIQAGHPGYPPQQGYPGAHSVSGEDPLVPPDFAGWFSRVIDVIRRSFAQLGTLAAILGAVSIVIDVISSLLMPDVGALGSMTDLASRAQSGAPVGPNDISAIAGFGASLGVSLLVSLVGAVVISILGAYLACASIVIGVQQAAGIPTTAGAGLRLGAGRAIPLIGWGLIAMFVTGIGYIFLLLPGLYLTIVFNATLLGVVVVERAGIGRCFELVNRRFLPTAGRILLAILAFGLCLVIIMALSNAVGSALGYNIVGSLVSSSLMAILSIPLSVAASAVAIVTYAELRYHDNGATTTTLAAELAPAGGQPGQPWGPPQPHQHWG
jgi:hypothetical protein